MTTEADGSAPQVTLQGSTNVLAPRQLRFTLFSFLYRHPVESGLATTLDSRGSLRPLACRRFSYPPSNDARPVTLAATTQPCQAPPSLDREYLQACNPACPAPACCETWGSWLPVCAACGCRSWGHAPGVTRCRAATGSLSPRSLPEDGRRNLRRRPADCRALRRRLHQGAAAGGR